MSQPLSRLAQFWKELKRRHVIRVATVYGITTWLIIQIVTVTFPLLNLPDWASTFILVICLIGFPIALIFAWAFEMSPDGIIRTTSSEAASNPYPVGKKKPFAGNIPIILLAAVILGQQFYIHFWNEAPVATAEGEDTEISIAVLPFTNMSNDKDQEYFCDGMTDQILTNLASVPGLLVMGRTSVMQYKNTELPIPEIAKQLKVKYLLEAGVQKIGNEIRVNAQLLKADGFHIWAEKFDRTVPKTAMFDIQDKLSSEIARSISEKLNFKLEHDTRPANSEAYDYFIEAKYIALNEYYWKYDSIAFERSKTLYEKAIAADPNFAQAYSGLADLFDARILGANNGTLPPAPANYDSLRKVYTEKGYELDPEDPFTNYMKGIYFLHTGGSIDSVFYYSKKSVQKDTKDPYYFLNLGISYNNSGMYDPARACIEKNIALDPLEPMQYTVLGSIEISLGNFNEGIQYFEKSINLEKNKYQILYSAYFLFGLLEMEEFKRVEDFIAGQKAAGLNTDYFENWYHAAKGDPDKMTDKEELWASVHLGNKESFFDFWKNVHAEPPGKRNNYLSLQFSSTFDYLRDDPRFAGVLQKEKERYEEFVRKYGELPF